MYLLPIGETFHQQRSAETVSLMDFFFVSFISSNTFDFFTDSYSSIICFKKVLYFLFSFFSDTLAIQQHFNFI